MAGLRGVVDKMIAKCAKNITFRVQSILSYTFFYLEPTYIALHTMQNQGARRCIEQLCPGWVRCSHHLL